MYDKFHVWMRVKQDDLRLWNFSDEVSNLTCLYTCTSSHSFSPFVHMYVYCGVTTTVMPGVLLVNMFIILFQQESPQLLDEDSTQTLIDLGFSDGQPLLIESKCLLVCIYIL